MGIVKSYPITKIVYGEKKVISDNVIVKSSFYKTNGEGHIVVKYPDRCTIILDETTTEHLTVKAMSNTIIKTNKLIDEEFEEIQLEKFASVELRYIIDNWYIMSSDGLKNS